MWLLDFCGALATQLVVFGLRAWSTGGWGPSGGGVEGLAIGESLPSIAAWELQRRP